MKKLLMLLCGFTFLMVVMPITALAQDGGSSIDPSALGDYFVSLAALVPLVVVVTGLLKKYIPVSGILAQILSWAVSIGLCYVGWLLKLGLFASIVNWWLVLVYGLAVGLAANGFFKIEFITAILNLLGLNKTTKALPKP